MERRIHLEDTPGYYKTSKGRKQSTIIENILISTYEWKKKWQLIVSLNKCFGLIKKNFNLVNSREPLLKWMIWSMLFVSLNIVDTAVSVCLPSTSTSVTEKDANKKDICTSLMAENCQGKKCDKHHTRLPYLWQVRIFGSWVSFNDPENQNIEKSYCSLSEIQDAEVC